MKPSQVYVNQIFGEPWLIIEGVATIRLSSVMSVITGDIQGAKPALASVIYEVGACMATTSVLNKDQVAELLTLLQIK